MIPTFWNPINVMKRPIPAGIAFLRHSGIAFAIYCLAPVMERNKNMIPESRMITRPA